ncbi:chloride channel protein [Riemerella anatipestifer]|nr:chloride channel protein [Riemerella anatipestifer]
MKSIFEYIRKRLKHSFDNIQNERLKYNLLQAIPFWIASLLTGGLAVMYAKLFEWSEHLLFSLLAWQGWLIFILAPIGFVLSWWLVQRYAPYSKGSGIPQVMASVSLATPRQRRKIKYLLSYKIIIVKILSSIILVLGGGAIGREGPTIQIAGSVFRFINQVLPKWWPKLSIKNMIMTGAAAGLSAAFNTPLGGVVFAVEELAKTHINNFKTALFTAVIVAGLTAQTLAGSYLYLGYPKTSGVGLEIILPVILVSFICGILSSKFSRFMLALSKFRAKFKNTRQQLVFLVLSALLIAFCAYFINREILGSGKGIIERLLFSNDKTELWYIPLFRMLGPAIAFTSGGAGGIFAPALSAGASCGAFLSSFLNLTANETNVIILAGMVSFLTGITRAPFTSAILVLEMTDRHSLIFYLMLSGMISSISALLVSRNSLYDELKENYLDELENKFGTPVSNQKQKIQMSDLGKKNTLSD